jgi:type II secretory pathway pseudopilin PulG
MQPFSKAETLSLIVIFLVLAAVSIPNFVVSLERSRDQIRRDDMGAITQALDFYLSDFEKVPVSSPDGRIMACLKPGDIPVKNKKGLWTFDPIVCNWGKDPFTNVVTGRVYLANLPRDPDYQKGAEYLYFSDGQRYQIYASMTVKNQAEIDPKIIARNLSCGNRICNIGRSYNVPIDVSIEEYVKKLLQK